MSTDRRGERITRSALISTPPEVALAHAVPEFALREKPARLEARAPQRQESRQMVRVLPALHNIDIYDKRGRLIGTDLLNTNELERKRHEYDAWGKMASALKVMLVGLLSLVGFITTASLLSLFGVALPITAALWVMAPALAFGAARTMSAAKNILIATNGNRLYWGTTVLTAAAIGMVAVHFLLPVFATAASVYSMALLGMTAASGLAGAFRRVKNPPRTMQSQLAYDALTEVDGELYDSSGKRL